MNAVSNSAHGSAPGARTIVSVRWSPKRLFKMAVRDAAKLSTRIENAVVRGDLKTAAYLQRVYLKSRSAKRTAVDKATRRLLDNGRHVAEGQAALDLADSLSAVRISAEPVRVFPLLKKAPGEFRAIHDHGQYDRARQHLAASAMKPFIRIHPCQHGTSNGGRSEAVRRVKEAFADKRNKWAVTADIKNFYSSIGREWLRARLPIGREITSTTLLGDDDPYRRRFVVELDRKSASTVSYRTLVSASRSGLPQGPCSSPLIADFVVGKVLDTVQFSPDLVVANYSDNFTIVGRSKAEVEQGLVDLRDAFARHPAGAFLITNEGVKRLTKGIDFLGYHLRRGKLPVTPTDENMAVFHETLCRHVEQICCDATETPKLRGYIRSWRSAFRHFDGVGFVTWHALNEYARACPRLRTQLEWCTADFLRVSRSAIRLAGLAEGYDAPDPVPPEPAAVPGEVGSAPWDDSPVVSAPVAIEVG